MARIERNGLNIDKVLHDFLVEEALAGTGVDADRFFSEFSAIVHDLAPKNHALLAKRDDFQAKLDGWYREWGEVLAPAGVTEAPRGWRSKSSKPSSRSTLWICCDSADCAMPSRSAAREKFPRSATSTT